MVCGSRQSRISNFKPEIVSEPFAFEQMLKRFAQAAFIIAQRAARLLSGAMR
jgi:hypothetical protein